MSGLSWGVGACEILLRFPRMTACVYVSSNSGTSISMRRSQSECSASMIQSYD